MKAKSPISEMTVLVFTELLPLLCIEWVNEFEDCDNTQNLQFKCFST